MILRRLCLIRIGWMYFHRRLSVVGKFALVHAQMFARMSLNYLGKQRMCRRWRMSLATPFMPYSADQPLINYHAILPVCETHLFL